ncbi:MAG: PAS domain S-box protein [Candidatus Brocadia sp.]|nr:PAS domain S-box protein [Candidatus Brocadia sp.]
MKFLIIDNNQHDREQIKQKLQNKFYGLEFLETIRQEDFDEAIDRGDFDLVLTDYRLNWTDGLWILRTIKERFPCIPVIMVTNTGSEEIAVEGMKSGLSDYVLKRHLDRLPVAAKECIRKTNLRKECVDTNNQARVSEESLPAVSKHISNYAYTFRVEPDSTLVCERVSEAFTLITGYTREEVAARGGWLSFIHPNDMSIFIRHRDRLFSGQSDTSEFRIITKNGTVLWLRDYAQPVWSEAQSRVIHIYGTAQDITEHKQHEEMPGDSEVKYQKLIETTSDAVFIADAETGIIIDANKRAEDLLGYPREEIIGMHQTQLHPQEEAVHYMQLFKDHVREGKAFTKDLYVRHKNSHRVPVEISASVTFIGNKKVVQGVFRDITEGKKMLEELKLFKILFSEMRDLAYVCDTNGNILYVNKIFEQFTGHKPEEFYGKPFAPLFDEENLKKALDAHTRTIQGESLQFELYFKDTGVICEYRNFQLRDREGNIVRTIGIARDITARKHAEDVMQENNQTLQALIQASPLAIIALDPNENVTLWNQAAERMFGWNQKEVLGRHLPIVPNDKQEESRVLRERALLGESLMGIEVRRQKRDGSPIDISIFSAPLRNAQGNIRGIMAAVSDITERKRIQAIDALFHEIDQLILHGKDLNFILSYVCTHLVDIFAYPLVWIGMKEADGTISISTQAGTHVNYLDGLSVRWDNTPGDECVVGIAVRSKQTQICSTQESAFQHCMGRTFKHGLQSFIAVPLCVQGNVLGVMNLYTFKPNAFDTDTVHLLENLATRISVTILIAIDQQQLRLQSAAIASVANAVFITDCEGRIEWINEAFTRLTGYPAKDVYGQNPRIFKSGKHDASFYQHVWQTVLNGEVWRGEVVNKHKDGSLYHVDQTITPLRDTYGKVTHFVAIHADITVQKQAEARILYMAQYDTLTNLPNRILFRDRLQQELAHAHRSKRLVAVMFLDLDRFKIVNDTLGHAFGDLLLKAVAGRLKGCIRKIDTVSRLGGDEFTFIVTDIDHIQDAALIAQKIHDILISPSFQVEGHEVHITPSIGIAMYPSDANDADNLIKKADTAMYHAKEQGRNTFKFYTEEMNVKNLERITLENGLRKAMGKGELLVYYQPQVDISNGQITGIEALVRWKHPELGMIYPVKFIPVAEETSLIIPIGEWVLMKACTQTKAWQDAGFPQLRLAVNLSVRQVKQKNFVDTATQILERTGFSPHHLDFEITESILMQNDLTIITALNKLKELGIRFAIDDFGTEYSSLCYLKRFPIDTLKIDRSFVQDITTNPDDAAIVTAIIAIADSLKLKVVAEGVENKEQIAFLRKLHCNKIQGYVYSHPLPAVDIEHLLQNNNRKKP